MGKNYFDFTKNILLFFKQWGTLQLLLLVLFVSSFVNVVNGQTWEGDVSSDWNTPGNWSTGAVPTNSGAVTIPSVTSPNVYPVLTTNKTCASITFIGNTGTLTVNSGITLTVTGAVTVNSSNSSPRDVSITGAGTLSCGSVVVGLSSSTPTAIISTKLTSTISHFIISGDVTLNSRSNTGTNNAIFNLESGIVNLSGRIATVNGGGSNNSTFSMATGAQSGTLFLSYNGNPFNLSGTGTSTTTLNGTSATVNYSRSGNQTVRATPYTNLTLSNSGTKTFTGVTTVSKIWSVESGVDASLGTGLTHTAGALQLRGYGQNSGYWGGTASSATNKSKMYFGESATGVINVSASCSSVAVSISGSNVICKNANTTFTATATNEVSPSYQWKVNGGNVGSNSTSFSSTTLNNGDIVTCVVTSGATTCYPSGTTATSNSIAMAVSTLSATATPSTVASGANVSLGTSILPTSYTATLLTEGFNAASIPTGWTTTNTSTGGTTANADWTLRPNGYFYEYTLTGSFPPYTFRSNDNSQFYLTNSAAQNGTITATTLRSPSMNSTGYTSLSLEFYQFYDDYDSDDSVIVEVTTVAGGASGWTAVATYTTDQGTQNGFSVATVNLNSYINQPTLYVRFRYIGEFEWFWAIDNVKITGSKPITYTYSWAATPSGTTAGLPGSAGTPSLANASITANPSLTTSYVATAVNSITGCTVASSATVVTVTPVITSFTPTSACSGSGISVVITGSAFTGATAVTFNNVTASFTVDSNTQITAILPATATTGTIKVTTPSGTVTSATSLTVNQVPTLTGVFQDLSVCDGFSASIRLTGLIPSSIFTINYTINSVVQPAVTGVIADASGNASFASETLSLSNNGQTLQITGITRTGTTPNCSASFTQNVTLSVRSNVGGFSVNGGASIASNGNTTYCPSTSVVISINPVAGATNYIWTVPTGWTIVSGDGTLSITATTGTSSQSGTVSVFTDNVNCPSYLGVDLSGIAPVAPTASKTELTCAVPTGTLTVTSPTPAAGRVFTLVGTNPVRAAVSNTTGVFSGLLEGDYALTYQNGSGCVSTSTTQTISPLVINTWNGTTWSKTGNTTPPTIDDVILFNANFNITSPIESCYCHVNAGVNITVGVAGANNENAILKVVNTLDVLGSGTITFENNASLVQTNDNAVNNGNIIYKRTTSAIKDFDYVYWSSPVEDQVLNTLSPSTDKFYSWASGGWATEARTNNMNPAGKGFIIRVPRYVTSQTVSFEGVPNNGLVNIPIQGMDENNLIGNPYPSAIDADAFINANSTIISGALYFWTHNTARAINMGGTAMIYTSDDYATYTLTGGTGTGTAAKSTDTNGDGIGDGVVPSGDIAAGQSFFVGSSTASGNFVFNNGMRISDSGKNSQFFKQTATKKEAKVEKSRIWLNLTNDEGAFKQLLVGYITGATNDKDKLYDGVSNNANKFIDFYSVGNSVKYTIQGRALPFVPTDEIPLGYKSTIEGTFKISIENTDGVLTNQEVYLEDKLTGNYHDLKNGAYSFTTAQGEFKDRFVLRYTGKTLGIGDVETPTKGKGVVVSTKKHQIKVNSFDETLKLVKVYDLKGSLVYNKEKLSGNEFVISQLTSSDQFLIVMIQLENGKWHSEEIIYQN